MAIRASSSSPGNPAASRGQGRTQGRRNQRCQGAQTLSIRLFSCAFLWLLFFYRIQEIEKCIRRMRVPKDSPKAILVQSRKGEGSMSAPSQCVSHLIWLQMIHVLVSSEKLSAKDSSPRPRIIIAIITLLRRRSKCQLSTFRFEHFLNV